MTTPPWRSFFSLLQNNVLDRRRWTTRQQLRLAIISWIERTYHRRRRQPRLGRLTPIEYETISSRAPERSSVVLGVRRRDLCSVFGVKAGTTTLEEPHMDYRTRGSQRLAILLAMAMFGLVVDAPP